MAHKSGFTCSSLGQNFINIGFSVVLVKRQGFDLWALGLMPKADQNSIQHRLFVAGLGMSKQVIAQHEFVMVREMPKQVLKILGIATPVA